MAQAAERQLRLERANRDEARAKLDSEIARIRGDIEQRGIGGRIADEATARALAALDDAGRIAGDSKGVIGGTIAILLLWFLRKPILSTLAGLMGLDELDEKGHGR